MTAFVESAKCGSRPASKVRVRASLTDDTGYTWRPAFAGYVGIVVRVVHSGSVMVRLPGGMVLPFGTSELEIIA